MKLFNHLRTVHIHRKAVMEMCFKCGLYRQGLTHDLSKYSLVELIPSVKYWTGKRSPIDAEIEDKGYSLAWLHHKGHNKHHYEYWIDPAHTKTPIKMPKNYLVEMFCDRVAASKTYLKDEFKNTSPIEYMDSKPQEKALMHPDTYKMLHYLFELYAEYGENFTCDFVKDCMNERY